MDQDSIQEFIRFSLAPYLRSREIEYTVTKTMRPKKTRKNTTPDIFYETCYYLKRALSIIDKYRKRHQLHLLIRPVHTFDAWLYQFCTQLEIDDYMIFVTLERYQVPIDILSLVVNKPASSLIHRHQQLVQQIKHDHPDYTRSVLEHLPYKDLIIEESDKKNFNPSQYFLRRIPGPIRFILEMSGVFALLFAFMWLIPQLRNAYESSVQKKVNEYLIDYSLTDSPPPDELNHPPKVIQNEVEIIGANPNQKTEPEILDTDSNIAKKQPKVRDGETWRFSFAGQGFPTLENEIETLVKKYSNSDIKPSVVPGGIQYDFAVKTSELLELKSLLDQLVIKFNRKSNADADPVAGVNNTLNMSWYKKKIMGSRKIPAAHVQVYVWISTL